MGSSRFEEKRNAKRDIPVRNRIPQILTDKCSTVFNPGPVLPRPVFGPVSVYSGKKRKRTAGATAYTGRGSMLASCEAVTP
jgi:hypothetical protein